MLLSQAFPLYRKGDIKRKSSKYIIEFIVRLGLVINMNQILKYSTEL